MHTILGSQATSGGASSAVLALALDQAAQAMVITDRHGRIIEWNASATELSGYTKAEAIGARAQDLFSLLSGDEHILEGDADDSSSAGQWSVRTGDGREISIEGTVTAISGPEGEVDQFILVAADRSVSRHEEAQLRLAAQEGVFGALNHRASDASIVMDGDFNVVYISPAIHADFGYSPEQVVHLDTWDVIHPDDLPAVRSLAASVFAESDKTERMVLRIKDAADEWRWVETALTNCLTDPDVHGVIVHVRDIHAQVEAERALRESEELHRAITSTAQEGIIAVTADGETILANETLAGILGVPLDEVYRAGALGFLPDSALGELSERVRTRRTSGPERLELPYERPDGSHRILSLSASPLHTDSEGQVGALTMISDVTDARQVEERLRWQALHDPLTGLPNRALLIDRLETAAARQERGAGAGIAVLFVDLDDFKQINDLRGHATGDLVLKAVATRLEAAVRRTDTVGRLGGDEFAVVCEGVSRTVALEVAHRVCATLDEPLDVEGDMIEGGASVGVALFPPHAPAELLRLADASMYAAKNAGGSRVVLYDGSVASS